FTLFLFILLPRTPRTAIMPRTTLFRSRLGLSNHLTQSSVAHICLSFQSFLRPMEKTSYLECTIFTLFLYIEVPHIPRTGIKARVRGLRSRLGLSNHLTQSSVAHICLSFQSFLRPMEERTSIECRNFIHLRCSGRPTFRAHGSQGRVRG